MHKKIRLALTGIVVCSAGTVMAGTVHELLDNAQMMSKLGMIGVMGVMVLGLVVSVVALCKFIANTIIPLKENLVKSSDILERVVDKMDEVHNDVKDCQRRN